MSDIIQQNDFIETIKNELRNNNNSSFCSLVQDMCSKKENIEIIDVNKFILDIFDIYETHVNNNKYEYNSKEFYFLNNKKIKVNNENDILYKSTPFMMEIIGYVIYHNNYVIDKMPKNNYALSNYFVSFAHHEKNKFYSKDFYLYGLIARISLISMLDTSELFKNINLFNVEESNSIFSKVVGHFRKNKFSISYSLMILEYNFENFFYNMFKEKLVDINDLLLINNNYKNFYYRDYNKDINELVSYKLLADKIFSYESNENTRKNVIRMSHYISKIVDNLIILLYDKNNLEKDYLSQFKIKENTSSFFSRTLLFSSQSLFTFLQILKSNNDLNTEITTDLFNLILYRPKNIQSDSFDFFYCRTLFDNEDNFTEFTNTLIENKLGDNRNIYYTFYLISLANKYSLNKNFKIQLSKIFDEINKTYAIDDFFKLLFKSDLNFDNIFLKDVVTFNNFIFMMDCLNKDFSFLSSESINILKNSKLNKNSLDILSKNNIKKSFLKNIMNVFKKNEKKLLQNNDTLLLEQLEKNDIADTKNQINFNDFSFESKYKEIIKNIVNNHKNILSEINSNNVIDLSIEEKQYIVNQFLTDFHNILTNCQKIINIDKDKINILEDNINLYNDKIKHVQDLIINSYSKAIDSTNITIKKPKI